MAGLIVSAAVVSGELILGLSDGSLIRAGYVQGAQGLQGVPGPMEKNGEPTRLALSLKAWGANSKEQARATAKAISKRNKK